MIDQNFIKNLSNRAANMFPAADTARQELEGELYQLLQRSLSRLQIVSHEEFQAQSEVLEKANQKISELEKKLESIEKKQNSSETE